jgi:protein regulator of cytokinesis 1
MMRTPSLFSLSSAGSSRGPPPPPPPDAYDERACECIFARYAAVHADDGADDAQALRGLEHVEPTPALLGWAHRARAALEDLKRRREAHIQAMYDQLEVLWRRLGVAERDMDGFVEAHTGSTEETVQEYEEELERMLELKRESMSQFVDNARAEIVKLWDELLVGPEEREDFPPFFDGARPCSFRSARAC